MRSSHREFRGGIFTSDLDLEDLLHFFQPVICDLSHLVIYDIFLTGDLSDLIDLCQFPTGSLKNLTTCDIFPISDLSDLVICGPQIKSELGWGRVGDPFWR